MGKAKQRKKKHFRCNGKDYFVYGHTLKELDENYRKKRSEIETGIINENITLNQYFESFCKRRKLEDGIHEGTISTDIQRFNAHIKPYLGSKALKKIDTVSIEDTREHLLNSGTLKTSTINGIIDVLNKVLHDAVKRRVIPFNPCDSIRPLKRTEPKAQDTIHKQLSPEEIKKLLELMQSTGAWYLYLCAFLLMTGLRISEALALKWEDVDEINHNLRVAKTVTRVGGKYFIKDSPKTESSKRTLKLSGDIIFCLKQQKKQLTIMFGEQSLNDLVFPNQAGALSNQCNVNTNLKKYCIKAGVDPRGTHAFRATFATEHAYAQTARFTLAFLLGHSNPSVTEKYYIGVPENEKETAIEKIDHTQLLRFIV